MQITIRYNWPSNTQTNFRHRELFTKIHNNTAASSDQICTYILASFTCHTCFCVLPSSEVCLWWTLKMFEWEYSQSSWSEIINHQVHHLANHIYLFFLLKEKTRYTVHVIHTNKTWCLGQGSKMNEEQVYHRSQYNILQ